MKTDRSPHGRTRNRAAVLGWMVPAIVMVWARPAPAQVLTIDSFDAEGQLTFTAVPGATSYRVEWAPTLAGPWSDFDTAADLLDAIDGPGSGILTCRVPMVYRVVADLSAAEGMVLIPAGDFQMGDNLNEGWAPADQPVHTVFISSFYMDRYEVTKELWDVVRAWGTTHGYRFSQTLARGKAPNHPVQWLNWYECVKWCNARSEMEGLTPVYYITSDWRRPYRIGEVDLANDLVAWDANGYRLPTGAEWEKASRGGQVGVRFPWGETIHHDHANYVANSNLYAYDTSPYANDTYHPAYAVGGKPYTSPVGSFPSNGYGLRDMGSNVSEWCWDWYQDNWYAQPGATDNDTPGPITSPVARRVVRGGMWNGYGGGVRCAANGSVGPGQISDTLGFRCVRRQ